ncbi:MAG: GntR family transcriptional regulator [Firmicutes bacterium]|nr:GntR family transcriptional regulator [Bacillota bacterium]
MTPVAINRSGPVPYYYQLKELIKDHIHRGRWQPGSRIPSEPQLCELYGVSRTVVRQALGELVAEGYLRKERGRGTFVAKPKIAGSLVQRLTGFYEDVVRRGLLPRTKVLSQSVVPAPQTVAAYLEIPVDTPVIRIERLRFVDDEPLLLVTTYIPYVLCPGLVKEDLAENSLYQLMEEKYGIRLARGRRMLEAVAATELEAQLLGVKPGAPLLYLRSITYMPNGQAIEYYEAKHRGDRSMLEVELIRTDRAYKDDQKPEVDLPPANTVVTDRTGNKQ